MTAKLADFGALAGIKVVDLSRVLGGPYCTQLLGDHGADIIKVEPPQGDEVRDWGPPFHGEDASYFIGVNRNKRAMSLDLSQDTGREVLLRLLKDADLLLENYKPGTMERWGIGYDTLGERFPRLIHARISGFGGDGPLGALPGYDAIVQAMAGMFSVNGEPAQGPTRLGVPIVDIGTGLYTAIAMLMAVIERKRSGLGQFIDMTLYDSAVSLMHPHISNYYLGDKIPGLTGNGHPNISPYDKFKTKTTDIFIGAGNNRAFSRLCNELGRPELVDDERFKENSDRVVNREALSKALNEVLAETDGFTLCKELAHAGLPAGPILNTHEVMTDAHTAHREMAISIGDYKGAGTPIKFSRTPGEMRRAPPKFAEHGDAILREHGFSELEIETFKRAGAVLDERKR